VAREQRRLAAIVAADVVGYSRMMGRDESGTLAALKAVRRDLTDPAIAVHGGRIVKTTGDGLLLEFPSVVDAVRCVVEVQTAMTARNTDIPEERRIVFRVGVNLGDIIIEGDDIFGDGVNVAARLQEIGEPGGACISSRVHEDVRDRLDVAFEDGGEQALKNIARPVRVWRWRPASTAGAAARPPTRSPARRIRIPWTVAAAAMVLTLGLAGWLWFPTLSPLVRSLAATVASTPAAAPISSRPGVAVLPFINLSGDPSHDYFSDGITEDVIVALGRFGSLTVMARNAVFPFKGKNAKPADIGRELGVRYLVEGSVRRAGERVRVSVQLTDTVAGKLLWSQRYDEELKDVFAVQDAIARQVAGALAVSLTQVEQRRALSKPAENLDAYDLVLRGRERLLPITRPANREARQLLERATTLDPRYAEAYAWLGRAYLQMATYGWTEDPDGAARRALDLGQKAVTLDPDSAAGHRVLGLVHLMRSEYGQASAEIDRVLALNPSDSEGLQGRAELLLWLGRFDQSIEAGEAALRVDPLEDLSPLLHLGLAYYEQHRHAEALRVLEQGVARSPDNAYLHAALAATFAQLDRMPEAARERTTVRRVGPFFDAAAFGSSFENPAHQAYLAEGLAKAGLN
jgi:TolB-like protein/class 3 adenylate cyclase